MSEDIFCMREDRIASYILFTFANNCMPTLMKLKPSSMVSFHKRYILEKSKFYTVLKGELSKFSCDYEILYESDEVFYILVYQEELLNEVLMAFSNHRILLECGYKKGNGYFRYNVVNFSTRFKKYIINKEISFPHEVGILLGYPIKDVEEYIKNNGENYVLCGCWKVYHNVEDAVKTFQYFKDLREVAIKMFFSGKELSDIQICVAF
jgi:hypothetical protein